MFIIPPLHEATLLDVSDPHIFVKPAVLNVQSDLTTPFLFLEHNLEFVSYTIMLDVRQESRACLLPPCGMRAAERP